MVDLIKKLPNWITISRLCMIPVFVALMHNPTRLTVNLATIVFIIAALTDYVDGFLARRYGAVSDFGKLLDPLVDKILVMSALVMLVAQRSDDSGEPWVEGWMVVLILAREIWVTGLRAVAANRGVVVAASNTGKFKSAFQMFAIVMLLMHDYAFRFLGYQIPFQLVGLNLLLISIALSYLGAIDYTQEILFQPRGRPPAGTSTGVKENC